MSGPHHVFSGVPLPLPGPGPSAAAEWVDRNLGDCCGDDLAPSSRFRGGQDAANAALETFDVTGYASRRNAVWPLDARGASGLSPWIRHGLLPLRRVWDFVAGGPTRDVNKFRSELLWQEYARHLYARVGTNTGRSLRFDAPTRGGIRESARGAAGMRCIDMLREELHSDGWIPNASRMWLASFWSVHGGGGWREGEDRFFQHLLDGSRAANRLGWQWTAGAQTGRRYFFDRDKVERHAPGWCADCELNSDCPLDAAIPGVDPEPLAQPVSHLSHISQAMLDRAPASNVSTNTPEAVWLTAESLGTEDPASLAHPDLPLLFVFDHARLHRWQLSRKRLVFLVETLAELALSREVELFIGSPAAALAGRRLAATYTPVPGWRAIADGLDLAQQHPWPWLIQPHSGPVASFSAWKKKIEMPAVCSDQAEFAF